MFNLFIFEYVGRLSIEIESKQHRAIKMLAAAEGMSIKDLILSKTVGLGNATEKADDTKLEASVKVGDETELLFSSAINYKRLRGAVTAPDEENIQFENLEDLADALGI